MMEYIIIAVIILLAIIIIGFMFRKKHLAEIERLEQLKLQIQNKPILEELTKVKQLNMNGQTEEMFERWRNVWTEIMDVHIPKIDASLYDAEEAINRFRFGKATKIEQETEVKIDNVDKDMNGILVELAELIGSDEKNRNEIDLIQEKYRRARKNLLAHQHSYGAAAAPLEKKLESFIPMFDEYEKLTTEGNYLKAREIVISLSTEGEEAFLLADDIPSLLADVHNKIPSYIAELRQGKSEMEEQSYYLGHLELTLQLDEIEEELAVLEENIAQLEIAQTKIAVEKIKDRIDSFYELLEKEVEAKHYVDEFQIDTERHLEVVARDTQEMEEESRYVQHSYKISESEAAIPKACKEKMEQLAQRYDLLRTRLEEDQSAYSSLQEELMHIREDLSIVDSTQNDFMTALKNLRVEETNANAKVEQLKRKLQETDRILHKANIPGIPEDMDVRLEEAEEHLFVAMQTLREVPLNMKLVDNYLEQAEKSIDDVHDKAVEMVENVLLIERIIQYGNRYRKSNQQLDAKLGEAEESFRQLRYSKALEEAATAVENFEPGSMKRIEVLVKEDAWNI
ncbi:septation ring formation regulator EzrA [Microbacterium sp. APC 3898]|uniref:Septation ring formation regulator EzrA n=2 Tax=Planococcus TaxID=1372 RepID=A0ABT7ZIS1_9BACL|nr:MULTISPECIES: septation ring formation regulator EzrA [Terrabacteria group]MBD8016541.1 septation ring formation regulator EzrA [Planococcus wigleyi]MDN3427049.1 septation ring formation regulator EzrA [Planococcus sp. APC 4016]MDN3439605.1 septation ring formation regulator EzrA [Planococcus sp. APC 3900]MDN3499801.1 septation ring formation regulator EzrA [Microbacterium sp. APC 3898]